MDDVAAPHPAPPRARRRVAWLIGGLVLLVVLLLVFAGGGLWWTVRSESGAAWVLSRLPGLTIQGGKGTLWGDYAAERIEFDLPGGGKLVMTDVGWRGMRLEHAPWTAYRARVVMDELRAQRVDVTLPPDDGKKEPPKPPERLQLPVEIDIRALRVGEVHAPPLRGQPLRELRARLHLGSERGALHRVDDLSLAWDRLTASGAARIASTRPFALDAKLALVQEGGQDLPAWQAAGTLAGPLDEPLLQATLRATPSASRPEQSLDVRAALRPFAAWPLGDLQASTKALDLSALHATLPVTALSGRAEATTSGLDQPANVSARFENADAGRWNEGRLPVRAIEIELSARPQDPRTLDLRRVAADLGTRQQAGGSLRGQGQWAGGQWKLDATLTQLQPSLLDARAPEMRLSGPVSLAGRDFGGPIEQATVDVRADLSGQFAGRGPARNARLQLEGSGSVRRIELRSAQAQAGAARASLAGVATHAGADAPWHIKAQATLANFDPAPWWPGRDAALLRKGGNRLNGRADVDLAVPPAQGPVDLWGRLAGLRGRADARVTNSLLAGVPLSGELTLRSADAGTSSVALRLDAAGNRVQADGRVHPSARGSSDQWTLSVDAPRLEQLAPLWRLGAVPANEAALSGTLKAGAQVSGRWPRIVTQGQLEAGSLRIGQTGVQRAQAQWRIDTAGDAAVDLQGSLAQLSFSQALFKGMPPIDSAQLQVRGTMRNHRLELRADTKALPPEWTETLQAQPMPLKADPANTTRSVALLVAQGGALDTGSPRGGAQWSGWRGSLQQLELRSTDPKAAPWLRTQNVGIEFHWAGGPARVAVQPGRAELLGAALRWSRVGWRAASGAQPALLDAQAELEPLPVAPLLARAQPDFGWGGDLAVVGRLNVRSAPTFTADIVLERQGGDLTVTDETGTTQALGLTDLRLGLDVENGTWSFTQGLAGKTLGVAAGAVVARTSPQATWLSPDTPIQGVLEVQVANLGTWGPWVPAGWRLTGALRTSAGIGGRFGAPEYTGEVRGSGIGVRNFLLGVNITDGDVAIALRGDSARIERFSARGGKGSVTLEGNATFGEAPQALLKLQADQFQLLGRVDRRIVTSGQAQLRLDRQVIALDGRFGVDEGLIDFSRSDAPQLSDDVIVVRGKPAEGAAPATSANPAPGHTVKLDLQVALGERLRLRGRGIDTGLRGDLRITSPGNQLAIAGTVSAVGGTYAAYGQKLAIERGLITFNGPAQNPRLDIEAVRPSMEDVRVGVLVTGTALNPRVRLFSEPEMSEIDKLSWLVLGRAADEGLGRADTALLQRAALALLAGEGESKGDQLTKAIGLDELSLHQSDGEVRETVISLGKRLSSRWYVGYERSLNATAGTWQLIYRIARRFTLRAQTGADSSLDLIWTWRWQ